MSRKAMIRERIQRRRQGLDHEWIRKNSQLVQHKLLQHRVYREARTIGLYLSRADEVNTGLLLEQAWADGKTVCVPRYDPASRAYELCRLGPETVRQDGPWGIPEPSERRPVAPELIDLMVIPAVALDRRGGRLGHGGGFYDRILSDFRGIKAGLVFGLQLVQDLPMQDHDIPVDFIITETDFIESVYYSVRIRRKK